MLHVVLLGLAEQHLTHPNASSSGISDTRAGPPALICRLHDLNCPLAVSRPLRFGGGEVSLLQELAAACGERLSPQVQEILFWLVALPKFKEALGLSESLEGFAPEVQQWLGQLLDPGMPNVQTLMVSS